MKCKCRKFEQIETERELEHDGDEDYIADIYVHDHVKMKTGDIIFIEVLRPTRDSWELWRVECVFQNQGYITCRSSKSKMLKELSAQSTTSQTFNGPVGVIQQGEESTAHITMPKATKAR